MTAYEDQVAEETDRWVAVQLEQAPGLRGEAMDTLWVLLGESASTE